MALSIVRKILGFPRGQRRSTKAVIHGAVAIGRGTVHSAHPDRPRSADSSGKSIRLKKKSPMKWRPWVYVDGAFVRSSSLVH